MAPFERLGHEDFAYLTTTGRRSGKRHTIGSGSRSTTARSTSYLVVETPRTGCAQPAEDERGASPGRHAERGRQPREVADPEEDTLARQLLDEKYMSWRPGKQLSSWARNALPVAIDL